MAPLAERVSARARWATVLVAGLLILYFSIRRPPSGFGRAMGPLGAVGLDKWLHALAFAGFAAVLTFALVDTGLSTRRVVLAVVVLSVGYGLAIELLQGALPTRHLGPLDLAADAIGTVAVVLVWRAVDRVRDAPATEPAT